MRVSTKTRHLTCKVGDLEVNYREGGVPQSTGILMLHGSPSSSYSFREVIPKLAQNHYVVAPDMPGFGYSSYPSKENLTFEYLAEVIEQFLDKIHLDKFILYVTDFSTPVGYYLATKHPERILGIVVQNGNVHEAGLGTAWDTTRVFLENPTPENRAKLPEWLNFEGTRGTYTGGMPERLLPLLPQESWHLDWQNLSSHIEEHFELFKDYGRHIQRFDEIAEYHKTYQPPCLVLWGRHDPFFDIAETLAFNDTADELEIHIYDGGHFLTETHASEIADAIDTFAKNVYERRDT